MNRFSTVSLRLDLRFAYTTSKPSAIFACMSAIISGGSCRSTSMTTHAAPREISMPAMVAAGWPKRRENRMSLTRGLRRISAWMTSSVLSGEGSRQNRIS